MPIAEELYSLDFLIYSAHKTGTQTLHQTLCDNGFRSAHCHGLASHKTRLTPALLPQYLDEYRRRNGRPLPILSVFREPIERHISSFFQWHGEGALRRQPGAGPAESLLAGCSVAELQQRFRDDLERGVPVGALESIGEFCTALAIPLQRLHYDPHRHHGETVLADCIFHLFRFDSLIQADRIATLLTPLAGRPIQPRAANLSAAKWYFPILQEFRATLQLPEGLIRRIHSEKADLLALMYGEQAEELLASILFRYGEGPARSEPVPDR